MALTKIKFYGVLGKMFGRVHKLEAFTPAEAITGLCLRLPGLEPFMMNAHKDGVEFQVRKGDHYMQSVDEVHHEHGGREICFIPVVRGAKGGLGTILVGAALITASFFTAGAAAAVGMSAAAAATAASAVFSLGASMALGGIMQMLSPQPKGLKMREDPDNKPSYAFGGPVNTTCAGNVVGLLYGEYEIGGAIISASEVTEDTHE